MQLISSILQEYRGIHRGMRLNGELNYVKAVGLTCAGESRYEALRLNNSSELHGDSQVLKLLYGYC